jgi:Zn-dependent peptidase ImmA (M78 family)
MTPEKYAQALREEYPPVVIPVPVEDIAKQEGFQVVRHRHQGPESAFALINEGTRIIGVNTNTSSRRQRTAIAHAFGHMLLHGRPIICCYAVRTYTQKDARGVGSEQEEAEANAFALELLIPAADVAQAFAAFMKDTGKDAALFPRDEAIVALSRQFSVSNEFMSARLVTLGLLGS